MALLNNAIVLRRYTSLPSVLHLLREKQIVLLSPATWDDRNDRFFMNRYKEEKNLKTLLALCFTETSETYHHWRVFTHNTDGICIVFRREEFISGVNKYANVQARSVVYKKIDEIAKFRPVVKDLPFLKRHPYSDEREFRIVYESQTEELDMKGLSIDFDCIESIVINPWLPKPLVKTLQSTIKAIEGCSRLRVYQTTLLENENWKAAALRAGSS